MSFGSAPFLTGGTYSATHMKEPLPLYLTVIQVVSGSWPEKPVTITSPLESTAPEKLTARQKGKIATIRREAEAKLAEREILFKSEQRAARGDPGKLEKIEEAYRRDREHLCPARRRGSRKRGAEAHPNPECRGPLPKSSAANGINEG